MKKILALILVLVLVPVFALADFDCSGMTDQELQEALSAISAELMSRHKSAPEGILIFEWEGVRVYQKGDAYISGDTLYIPVAVYNEMDHEMVISAVDSVCNGWDVYSGNCRASGNAKNKDDITFKVSDADMTSIDQIEGLRFKWQVYDFSVYEVLYLQEEREEHRFW